jgi:hypothetical protein
MNAASRCARQLQCHDDRLDQAPLPITQGQDLSTPRNQTCTSVDLKRALRGYYGKGLVDFEIILIDQLTQLQASEFML